jgi:hypothetical protein
MLRVVAILAVTVAFPAASFAARAAETPPAGGLVAKVVACDVTSDNRAATFYARMDSMPGAAKLQVRFKLLERLGRDDSWSKLDVPALRLWHTSQAGVKRFGWTQTVDALRIGGAYKARVQYRWLTAAGIVLGTATRETPVCRGPLPNIAIGSLSVKPGPTADTRTYRVEVLNKGKIAADQVDVSLSVDRAVLDTVAVSNLVPGETRVVSFTGPVCSKTIRVNADPDNSIGETIEGDNAQQFACS